MLRNSLFSILKVDNFLSCDYFYILADILKNTLVSYEQSQKLEDLDADELSPTLDGLNSVSGTPWIINKPILDLIISIFNNGGNDRLEVPPPASTCGDLPRITP